MIVVANKKICYKEYNDYGVYWVDKILISSPLTYGECETYTYKKYNGALSKSGSIKRQRFKVFEKNSPGLFFETYQSFKDSLSVNRESLNDVLCAIASLVLAIVVPRIFVIAFIIVIGGILFFGVVYNFMKLVGVWRAARNELLIRKKYSDSPKYIVSKTVPKKWLIKNNKKSREDDNESWFNYD